MTAMELRNLLMWAKGVGFKTMGGLQRWVKKWTDGSKRDILNRLAACYANGITMMGDYYERNQRVY